MSRRWSYKVVELKYTMFGETMTDRAQQELDKLGQQGWELVSALQSSAADSLRLILKKES